ncbi:hypothetical protein ACUWEX_09280 [Okibacterium fritillariae]|uniref:hypothetical protein n=1 Tax=Okibacterium fritillariae TaxID=123320 RepID=UPI0040554A1F
MASSLIRAVQWREDDIFAVKFGSGRVVGFPAPDGFKDSVLGMTMVEYRPWSKRLIFERGAGFVYNWEVGSPSNWAPLKGRPVVYLDQNHWSTLSKQVFAPHRVSRAAEGNAARALLQLAEAKKVILPFSAAHLSETAAWSNERGRLELVDTIFSGSGGWQMLDPLKVRSAEFRASLRASAGLSSERFPDVFTLAPFAALDSEKRNVRSNHSLDIVPDGWEWIHQMLLSAVVYVSCMMDRAPTPRGNLDGWVDRVREFSEWLSGEKQRTKEQRRRAAYVFALSDTTNEVSKAAFEVGLTPDQMSYWNRATWDSVEIGAPGISLFRAAMVDKLLAGSPWEANDLTDLVYLSTAAAYSDHVVGERGTIALLRQAAARLKLPVQLHSNLASLEAVLTTTRVPSQ